MAFSASRPLARLGAAATASAACAVALRAPRLEARDSWTGRPLAMELQLRVPQQISRCETPGGIADLVDFERILHEDCALFTGVERHEICQELIQRLVEVVGEKVSVRKGQVVIQQGEENAYIYIVGFGTLNIEADGKVLAEARPKRGRRVVGVVDISDRASASSITVRVTSDFAYLLRIHRDQFLKEIASHPKILKALREMEQQRKQSKVANEGMLGPGRFVTV